jgi:hypothetical protein
VSFESRYGRCCTALTPSSSLSLWMIVDSVSRLWLIYFASRARIPLLLVIFAHSDPARSTRLRVDTLIGTSVRRSQRGEPRWRRPEDSELALDSMINLKRVWERELFSFISVEPTWR